MKSQLFSELTSLPTRREVIERCYEFGISGEAAETIAAAGAPIRHDLRVAAAQKAASEWAGVKAAEIWFLGGDASVRTAIQAALAWAVCKADAAGIGGWRGLTGQASERHPAFATVAACKQSRGGPVWDAVIACAADRLEQVALQPDNSKFYLLGWCVVYDGDPLLAVRWTGRDRDESGHISEVTWSAPQIVTEELVPRPWQATIAWSELCASTPYDAPRWAELFNHIATVTVDPHDSKYDAARAAMQHHRGGRWQSAMIAIDEHLAAREEEK